MKTNKKSQKLTSTSKDLFRTAIALMLSAVVMRYVGAWEEHNIAWYTAAVIGLVLVTYNYIKRRKAEQKNSDVPNDEE